MAKGKARGTKDVEPPGVKLALAPHRKPLDLDVYCDALLVFVFHLFSSIQIMPKEDRSDWVAVEPEFAQPANEIRKAASAYQFFQKDVAQQIRNEYGKVDIAEYGRIVKEKWNSLPDEKKEYYAALHRDDVARFAQESHAADVAALERREKLLQERNELVIDDSAKRLTRGRLSKKQRKEEKRKRKSNAGEDHDDDDAQDDSEASWDSNEDSSSDDDDDEDDDKPKVKKAKKPPSSRQREASQKQLEYRAKIKQEKQDKEEYIAGRQEVLRKERSAQAKKRLEYLLQQGGNIFSHFGRVKEDTAKYGIKRADRKEGERTTRRPLDDNDDEEEASEALEEADEHEATRLTAQPATLGYGKMRPYQIEGLNWMIRLQENGVNGILADGKYFLPTRRIYLFICQFVNNVRLLKRWDSVKLFNRYLFLCTCWNVSW